MFVYSSVGHSDCLHLLAVVGSAAVNIRVHVFAHLFAILWGILGYFLKALFMILMGNQCENH